MCRSPGLSLLSISWTLQLIKPGKNLHTFAPFLLVSFLTHGMCLRRFGTFLQRKERSFLLSSFDDLELMIIFTIFRLFFIGGPVKYFARRTSASGGCSSIPSFRHCTYHQSTTNKQTVQLEFRLRSAINCWKFILFKVCFSFTHFGYRLHELIVDFKCISISLSRKNFCFLFSIFEWNKSGDVWVWIEEKKTRKKPCGGLSYQRFCFHRILRSFWCELRVKRTSV